MIVASRWVSDTWDRGCAVRGVEFFGRFALLDGPIGKVIEALSAQPCDHHVRADVVSQPNSAPK
jgi:hypothetical protein